jgi:prolyl-tRNA editing enzyme YbaK/EbsC (Cys-tRNA(Pro) deacylase)
MNLDLMPAVDHPELLAPVTAKALTMQQNAEVAAIDPELADTAEFCARYGVSLAESANCVVVAARRAGVISYAACVVLATTRADINGLVRRHLGARKISFASMQDAVELTGMEYGGITPIGLPSQWPVLIDPGVIEAGRVIVGSGIRGSKIRISGAELARLPSAQVLPGLGMQVS